MNGKKSLPESKNPFIQKSDIEYETGMELMIEALETGLGDV